MNDPVLKMGGRMWTVWPVAAPQDPRALAASPVGDELTAQPCTAADLPA